MTDLGLARSHRGRLASAAVGLTLVVSLLGPLAAVRGVMTASQVNSASTFTTGAIFPGARTTSAWSLTDASGGAGANASDTLSFAGDGRSKTSGNFGTAFSSTRYVELAYYPSLPAGVPVSGATLLLDFAAGAAGSNTCVYFDVRRISTGAVLATHGGSSTPILCTTSTTAQATSTALPEVASSDLADDLKVRVYASSSGSKGLAIDRATVTATAASTAYTLYESSFTDASTGTATATAWSLAVADAATYASASNWPTAWSASRYLQFTFPAIVPPGATVTSATLIDVWKDATSGDTICHYLQAYNGASLVGSHGSSGTPQSCNASGTTWTTDTVALPEVTTPAIANALAIRFVGQSSTGRKSLHDQVQLSVTYRLP